MYSDYLLYEQFFVGRMYKNGRGVPQNYRKAVKWYRLSAEQGEAIAQYNLGVVYAKGKGGIQDYGQAHKWFNIAEANGHEMGRKNRGLIEKRMTSDQIAGAKKLARQWMEKHWKDE